MSTLIKTGIYFYLSNYIVQNMDSYIDSIDNPLVKYLNFTKKIDKKLLTLILVIIFFNIY